MTIDGGCLCRAVRYRVEAEPLARIACHCRDCQYLSGGAEANVIVMSSAALTLVSGEPRTYRTKADSGAEVWRSFCPICGTPMFAGNAADPEATAIRVGSLDDPTGFRRQGHIWTASAPPWHRMEPELPMAERNSTIKQHADRR